MAKTMAIIAAVMAAAHVISVMTRAAVIVALKSSSVQNNTSIAKGKCDERCHNIGRTAARMLRRTLGTMLSKCVAPLAIR